MHGINLGIKKATHAGGRRVILALVVFLLAALVAGCRGVPGKEKNTLMQSERWVYFFSDSGKRWRIGPDNTNFVLQELVGADWRTQHTFYGGGLDGE